MKIKALITGITGMVGSHLADYLLVHTDWDVYGVCRWRSPLDNVAHLLERVNRRERVFFEYADLNDEMSLVRVIHDIRPDYVFHLAAQSYPLTSFTAPVDTLNTNVLGTCRLLEAIRMEMERGAGYKPVVHVCASSEVFGKIRNGLPAFQRSCSSDKPPCNGSHWSCFGCRPCRRLSPLAPHTSVRL